MAKKKVSSSRAAKSKTMLPRTRKGPGPQRKRAVAVRKKPRSVPLRSLDDEREIHPLTPLFSALQASKIRFMIIGMSAAIMQGAPGTTLDYDIWINLPSRQYIKVINICRKLGAEIFSSQVVELNGLSVNFVCEPHDLKSFRWEMRTAVKMNWQGVEVPVLPLERIIAAKEFIGREKDIAQLPILRTTLRSLKHQPK